MSESDEILSGSTAEQASDEYRYLRSLNQSLAMQNAPDDNLNPIFDYVSNSDDDRQLSIREARSGSPLLWAPPKPIKPSALASRQQAQFTSTPLEAAADQQSAFSIFQLSQPFSSSVPQPAPTQSTQPALINDGRLGLPINPTPPQPRQTIATELHLSIPNHFNTDGSVLPLNQVLQQSQSQRPQAPPLPLVSSAVSNPLPDFRVPEQPASAMSAQPRCNALDCKTPKQSQTPRLHQSVDEFDQTPSAMHELLRHHPFNPITPPMAVVAVGVDVNDHQSFATASANKTMILASETPVLPRHLSALGIHGGRQESCFNAANHSSETEDDRVEQGRGFPSLRVVQQTPPDLCSIDVGTAEPRDDNAEPTIAAISENNIRIINSADHPVTNSFDDDLNIIDNFEASQSPELKRNAAEDIVFVAESPQMPDNQSPFGAGGGEQDPYTSMIEHGQPQDIPLSGESIVISQSQEPIASTALNNQPDPRRNDVTPNIPLLQNEQEEDDYERPGKSTENDSIPRLSLAYETSQQVDFTAVVEVDGDNSGQSSNNGEVGKNSQSRQKPPNVNNILISEFSKSNPSSPVADRFNQFLAKRGKTLIIQAPLTTTALPASRSAPITAANSPGVINKFSVKSASDNINEYREMIVEGNSSTQETIPDQSQSPIREGMIRHTINQLESGIKRQMSTSSKPRASSVPFIVDSQDLDVGYPRNSCDEQSVAAAATAKTLSPQQQPQQSRNLQQSLSPSPALQPPPRQTPSTASRQRMRIIDSDDCDSPERPSSRSSRTLTAAIGSEKSGPSPPSCSHLSTALPNSNNSPGDYRILQRVWCKRSNASTSEFYWPGMIYSLHLDHAVIAFANEQEMENFAFESLMVWQLAAGDTALLARQSNAGEKQTHLRVFIAAVMPDNDQLIVMEMADKGQLSVVSWKDLLLGPDDLSFRQMRNRLLTDEPKLRNGFRPRTAASENRSSIAPTTPLPSAFERTCNTPSAQRKRRKSGAAAAAALPSDCTVSTMAERKPAKSSTTTGNRSKRQRILEIGETALSEVNQSCLSPSVLAQQRLIRSRRVFEGYLFLLTSIGSNNDENASTQFRKRLEEAGGEIWEIGDFEKVKGRRAVKQRLLLAAKPCRTTKYFLALATEIPRVHIDWAEESMKQNSILTYNEFLLPNGESTDRSKRCIIQHSSRSNILQGRLLYLHGAGVEKETWSLIVKQAGGQVAIKKTTANIDFAVVFDEDRVNNDAAAVGSIVASANVPIVRKEWLCQSLIHQRMLPADQYLLLTGDQGSRNKRTRQTNRRKIK